MQYIDLKLSLFWISNCTGWILHVCNYVIGIVIFFFFFKFIGMRIFFRSLMSPFLPLLNHVLDHWVRAQSDGKTLLSYLCFCLLGFWHFESHVTATTILDHLDLSYCLKKSYNSNQCLYNSNPILAQNPNQTFSQGYNDVLSLPYESHWRLLCVCVLLLSKS